MRYLIHLFTLCFYCIQWIMHTIPTRLWLCTGWSRPISQISQCTCLISHNAPFRTEIPRCTRPKYHNAPFRTEMCTIMWPEWCIVGYGTGALWDLWNSLIVWLWYKRSFSYRPCCFFALFCFLFFHCDCVSASETILEMLVKYITE